MIKRRSMLAGTAGWTIVAASAVRAQSWPSQPVKIVVPYIPGGSTDTAGRMIAEKLTPLVGQQVIVENRGGGNTIIGMELVAKSKPDGHTLLLGTTTLATNAIIERKGARTAMIVTEGFRDSIEMAFENRFEQYDIFMDKPAPLVPRDLRFGVPERLDGRGNVLLPLDEAAVTALLPKLDAAEIKTVAVGYMHAYLDGTHERRTREILNAHRPDLWVTLASEVSPDCAFAPLQSPSRRPWPPATRA